MPDGDRAPGRPGFGAFVQAAQASGALVVQPRMGFGEPAAMRRGLIATKRAPATTVGTMTLDSFTRTGRHDQAHRCLADGTPLNGFPIVAHGAAATRAVLDGVLDDTFPVQVRHGCANPAEIIAVSLAAGLDATEGGPVSYCLPYGRIPLRQAVDSWARCCETLAGLRETGGHPHLETFGGCLMGQLCPPSLLVAMSVLEGLFFRQHGLADISLSYAQQTDPGQDEEAVLALRRLAGELLTGVRWHVVIYTYMGVFPRTLGGASLLGGLAARLAARTGAARLIVKTAAEAHRIPSIGENIVALRAAAAAAAAVPPAMLMLDADVGSQTYAEARALVEAVLELHADLGAALLLAFRRGLLDVPFCLHPDNAGRASGYLDRAGRLRWGELGGLPLRGIAEPGRGVRMTAATLLESLHYVQRRYDRLARARAPALAG